MSISVLMFCSQFRPLVGGAERQAEKLSKALVHHGVRLTVLTPRLDNDSPEYERDDGFVLHRFPLFDLCKRFPKIPGLGPLNLVSIREQTIRAVSSHLKDKEIVHTHIASPMSAFAMEAARKRKIPVLCKVAMAGERTDFRKVCEIGLGGNYIVRKMIRHMDRWIAITQAVRQSLLEWGVAPDKIVMIPNGVDLPENSAPIQKRRQGRHFLYLGRLSTGIQRDVPTLINAFDCLADQVSDAELALVGDGDLYQETVDLVRQTRNRERIQMPGQQVPGPWLQWADSLILPSRREGLSNALLEAMAQGLACIANDIPSNREVLDDGAAGVLVPVGDVDRLHMAVRRFAMEPGFVGKMGDAASQRVRERYSIEAVAEQCVQLYEQLLKVH